MNPGIFGVFLTNPAILIGGLALSIPFAVHLLTRRTPKTIVFPTLRFLRAARAARSRIHRLRHPLVLLLRTLFLALLLLAFLKPVRLGGTLSEGLSEDSRTAAVILVDRSASAAYSGKGITPLARAAAAAEEILDDLSPADTAALVFTPGLADAPNVELSDKRFHLKRDLEAARPSFERAGIQEALAEACSLLEKSDGNSREIHLLSDFQKTNWEGVDLSILPSGVKVVFLPVGDEEPSNVGLIGIDIDPRSPTLRDTVHIDCRVANHGPFSAKVPVRMRLEGVDEVEKEIDLEPGETASATFAVKPGRRGEFEGEAWIPNDSLTLDDRRYFVLTAGESRRVSIASDAPPDDRASSRRFLAAALDPHGGERSATFDPRTVDSTGLANESLDSADFLLIAGLGDLSEETVGGLLGYLEHGGRILWFMESRSDSNNLETMERLSGGSLQSPLRFREWIARGRENPGTFAEADFTSPMLERFRDEAGLRRLKFYRYFKTEKSGQGGEALLKYDDGNTALARTSVGEGFLVLSNFSVSEAGGDLAKSPLFIPLLHEMLKGADSGGPPTRSFLVGSFPVIGFPASDGVRDLRFSNPDGETINAGYTPSGEDRRASLGRASKPGFYRVFSDGQRLGSAALNVDPRESDLAPIDLSVLEERAAASGAETFAPTGSEPEAIRSLREGAPLWHYFLLGALLTLLLEQTVGLFWKR